MYMEKIGNRFEKEQVDRHIEEIGGETQCNDVMF